MKKSEIENRGLSGLPLTAADVATTCRDPRYPVMTMRHVWREDCDARIWHAVRRAAVDGLITLADRTGRPAELYAAEGHVLEQRLPRGGR